MNKRTRLLTLTLVTFFILQGILPGFCEKYSKERLRSRIQGMDSPTCEDEVYEMVKDSPKALEELILWKDPKNYYGRLNGAGMLFRLTYDQLVPIEKYFDVMIQILSKIEDYTTPYRREEERRHDIFALAGYGGRPLKQFPIPIYKGIHSSVGFFLICVKTLAKYNLIKRPETLNEMVNQITEVKNNLEKGGDTRKKEALQKLQGFLEKIEHQRSDFAADSYKVVTLFAKNIIAQLEEDLTPSTQ